MQILINHMGYEVIGPKTAVLQTSNKIQIDRCWLLEVKQNIRKEVPFHYAGVVDHWKGRHFYTLNFGKIETPGIWRINIRTNAGMVTSESFEIKKNLFGTELISDLLFYFKANRSSGEADTADRKTAFFGNRKDFADVHGGWFDASGDTGKYLSHLSYANYMNPQQTPMVVWSLLDVYERLSATGEHKQFFLDRILEEAIHGADFLLRMLDDKGFFYTTVFDQWSKDLSKRRIASYATQQGIMSENYQAGFRQGGGVAVAALARAGHVLARAGSVSSGDGTEVSRGAAEHAAEVYVSATARAYDHLKIHNAEYLDNGKENIIDEYCALLGASELFAATGEMKYRIEAADWAELLCSRISSDANYSGWLRADEDGEIPYFHAAEAGLPIISLLRVLEAVDNLPDSNVEDIQEAIKSYLQWEQDISCEVVNPFLYPRQYIKALEEKKKSSFFYPHRNWSGYWWQGENSRIASIAAARFRVLEAVRAGHINIPRPTLEWGRDFGHRQIDWILGCNPFDICMFQGRGRNNPTYEEGLFNVPGGICNGITSGFADENDIAFLPEEAAGKGDQRWRWSEQWIVHAAWFTNAISFLA